MQSLRRAFAVTMLVALPQALAGAQQADPVLVRVQQLVNAGNRVGARAVADSLLAAAAEGTTAYATGLYVRAFASSSAAEAERDYLRVSIEYPLSPYAAEAMMMVAQLRLARGDRSGARRMFERLMREHSTGALSAKAAFWAGRLALEDEDLARGCPSLVAARERAAGDVELVNQVDYYLQRCPPPGALPPVPADTAPSRPTRAAPPPPPARRPAPPPPTRDTTRRVPPPADTMPPSPPARPGKEYSVQVAAFPRERDAQALVEVLKQRGYEARMWGTAPPFRVRVGRYPTREDATAAAERMKAARLNAMVVEAEPQ